MSCIQNLIKDYGDFKIQVDRVEIPDEGITLVQGPSGAGKTSFLRVLMGLDSCKSFSWEFQGQDLAKLKSRDRHLGVVFQSLELFPHMTAYENIYFHARARKISRVIFEKNMESLFEISKMRPHFKKPVRHLSGGEKQRVALLRAFAGNPQILLLDEPFSSLDLELKQNLKSFLETALGLKKIPCLMVSHDPEDAQYAKKILFFSEGKIIKETQL